MKTTTKQQVKWFLLTWLILLAFALIDTLAGLFWLHRMLNGAADSRTLLFILGLSERILGLGAISLFAFRFVRGNGPAGSLLLYFLLGLNAGIMLFAVRGMAFTFFMLSQPKLVLFDFLTLREALVLSATCVVICTSVGLLRRAAEARRERIKFC